MKRKYRYFDKIVVTVVYEVTKIVKVIIFGATSDEYFAKITALR